jgi:hypothetical protein
METIHLKTLDVCGQGLQNIVLTIRLDQFDEKPIWPQVS